MACKTSSGAIVCLFISSLLTVNLSAQMEDPNTQQGLKAYASYHGGDIDSVSLVNGKVALHAALVSFPQRGKVDLSFNIEYDNPQLSETKECQPPPHQTQCTYYSDLSTLGVMVVPSMAYGIYQQAITSGTVTIGYVYSVQDPSGASHPLGNTSGNLYKAVDSTGYAWNSSTNVITNSSGSRFYNSGGYITTPGVIPPPVTKTEDPNGNQISYSGGNFTDTMGRTIPVPPTQYAGGITTTDFSSCTGALPIYSAKLWQIPGPNGATSTYKFCFAQVTINWLVESGGTNHIPATGTYTLLQSIVLPNDTSWTFDYDNTGSGRLSKITLPTGGNISYSWLQKRVCAANVALPHYYSFSVLGRTLSDGSNSWPWHYSIGTSSATVTDPLQNDTTHTFSTFGTTPSCDLYETQTQYYQGLSTASSPVILKTLTTDYAWDQSVYLGNSLYTVMNVRPIRVTTSLPLSSGGTVVRKTEKDYDSGFGFTDARGTARTGIYGNVIAEREYDYAPGAPGSLLRNTLTAYQAFSNSNYLTYNLLDVVSSVAVYDSTGNTCKGVATYCAYTSFGYDESTPTASGVPTSHHTLTPINGSYRANQTSVNRWLNTTGTFLSTVRTFYDTGMVLSSKDPNLNPTAFGYSSTYVGTYATTVTNALTQTTTYLFDFNSGQVTSATDPNGKAISTFYDNMARVTETDYPDGGQRTYCYTDAGGTACSPSGPPYQVVVGQKIADPTVNPLVANTVTKTTTLQLDGLGRLVQSQLNTDPDGITYVDITYDGLGRKHTVSNPHRGTTASTDGTTTFGYDGIGRTQSAQNPDGTAVMTTYSGNSSTVTDEAGNARTIQTDGLGRVAAVWESPSGANYQTNYQYDALDNLICAVQKGTDTTGFSNCASASAVWRPRSFGYDSLSRLTSATNPESGTIGYLYDADGNLKTKTAPLPNQIGNTTVTTNYSYDALNRLTQKTYTGMTMAPVTYGYDGVSPNGCTPPSISGAANLIGRRTGMCDASGATAWNYDPMGRETVEKRLINGTVGVTKSLTYGYNYDGSLASLTYPSGRLVNYGVSGAARPVSAIYVSGSQNYVTNVTYAPQGAIATLQNGPYIQDAFSYNSRLQPLQMYVTKGTISSSTLSQLALSSCPTVTATILSRIYGFGLGVRDNGNVNAITNCRDTNRTAHYDYDGLNRILDAYTSGPNWGEAYSRDTWGNLTNIGPYAGNTNYENLNASPAYLTNQLPGFGYDAAGNMSRNGTASYTYDAENRLATFGGVYSYVYDGDGKRVEKCASSPCTTGTLYWTGIGSDTLLESDLTGTGQEEYIFFNGKRVARRDNTGGVVHYYFSDHLGSHTVIQSGDGSTCEHDVDYYPYGGVEQDYCGGAAQNYMFTGKERDSESGLDMFGARYYGSSLGRFMTPDWAAKPIAVPYAMFGDPQSLNLYSYVRNNPLAKVDLDGHCPSDNPNCNNVKVETQNKEAKIVKNETIAGEPGKRTGVEASATYKITENGKALTNTTVQENNDTKTTVDGKPLNIPSFHGPGATDDHGSVKDDLSLTAPAQPGVHDDNLVQGMSSSAFVSTDKQVMTFKTPEGATCSATSDRVLTNVGADGKPSGVYTVTAPNPVVKTVPPPNQ